MNEGMNDYVLNLTAGVPEVLDVDGNYFQIRSAASPVMLVFNGEQEITREQGEAGPRSPFSQVKVRSEVDQIVSLSLGNVPNGSPYDSRATFTGTVNAVLDVPNDNNGQADVSIDPGVTAVILGADPSRLAARLLIPSAAADSDPNAGLRIGKTGTVSDASGSLLEAGVVDYFPGTGQLSAHNPTANQITLTVTALRSV